MNKSLSIKQLKLFGIYLALIILVLLPFHAILTVWLSSLVGHYTLLRLWKEILMVIMSVFAVIILIKDKKLLSKLLKSKLMLLMLLYILIHVVVGIWAYESKKVNLTALGDGLITNLRLIVFFALCLIFSYYNDFLKKNWDKILLIPAALVIVFGLMQHFILPLNFLQHLGYNANTIAPYQTVDQNINYVRIQSTLRGSNPLGAYLILIIPAALAFFIRAKKGTNIKKVLFIYIIAAITVLFYSYSRSAWAGAIIASGFVIWLMANKKLRFQMTGLFILLLIAFSVSLVVYRHNTRFEDTFFHTSSLTHSPVSSDQNHESALISGLKDIAHNPLGKGPGSAGPASVHNNHPPLISEDYFLQIAEEVGVIGLIVFLAIYIYIGKILWQQRRDALSLVLFASLLGITLVNLFSHAWTDDTLGLIWWGLAGVASAPVILDR